MNVEIPGPANELPVLLLPAGPDHDGFLILQLRNGNRVPVPLAAAKIRLLLALDRAMGIDAQQLPETQGWRRPEQLVAMLTTEMPRFYPIEAQTVRAYFAQVKRAIRDAVRAAGPDEKCPPLLEHRRGLGVRLTPGRLRIIDRNRPADSHVDPSG